MAKNPKKRVPTVEGELVEKVVSTPRGPANAIIPVATQPYSVNVQYQRSEGIVRGDGADWFGPLNPMAPLAPPQVAGRRYDFQNGYNLAMSPRPYEPVGFGLLRTLADAYDLLRLVIETRKSQLSRERWSIHLSEKDKRGRPKTPTPEQQAKIDELTKFWTRPDGENRWRPWLMSLLEDKFVIDAPALYCQRSRTGKLLALKQIDGATVKVVLDDWGRTPQPYIGPGGQEIVPPAYQQILKGMPAIDYSVRDVFYRPYNRRVNKAYGFSEVEQILVTVNIGLRREMFQLSYYTEGNVPEALIGVPDTWTPEQIATWQMRWDNMLTGNFATRRRGLFVPGGVAKTFIPTKEPDLKNPMDEWLSRIICFAFSLSPQSLVSMMNRATADTAQEVATEEGIEPLKEWICELVNDVNEREFGVEPGEIVFEFDEEQAVDPKVQSEILTARASDGAITLNEYREELGYDKYDDPAADLPMMKTATGYVPIGANTLEGKKAAIDAGIAADPTIPAASPFGAPGGGAVNPKGGNDNKNGGKVKPKDKSVKPKKPVDKFSEHEPHAVMTDRMAKAARRGRRLAPVPFEPKAAKKAVKGIVKLLNAAFERIARQTAAAIRAEAHKVAKAVDPDKIASSIDLSALETAVYGVADELEAAASSQGLKALAQVGPNAGRELVNQVNRAAVDVARNIAAELVGKRWVDGELVDNPNAVYRIDESTRDMIRSTIADGLEENIGADEIAKNIEESTAFSPERSELIAYTEVRRANSAAAVEGYRGAAELGINVKKEWLLGDNPCPICEDNNDEGAIELDDVFPSGDDAPPAHPNCECAISPVIDEDAVDDTDEDE